MKTFPSLLLLFILVHLSTAANAQAFDKIIEFLTIHPNKKAVKLDSTLYPAKMIFTPVISFAPETNLSFGVGMKSLFKLKGSGNETRTSNMPVTAQYTIENKFLFFSGFQVFFPQEKYVLAGNLRIQSFPSLYFGIGQNTPKTNEEEFAYSQILFEPILLKNVFIPYFFVGSGIRYNKISNVESVANGLLALSDQPGASGSTSSGLQLAMIYDSRDNLLNPKKGMYLEFTHGFYGQVLGGTQSYQLSRFDLRYYLPVSKKTTNVLAFQLQGQLSHGDTPLLEMGRLGGDESLRGYFEGRYTDRHLLASQVEWRQKINKLWGYTIFAGLGSVAPEINKFGFDNLRPAIGIGLRFLVDPHEDLNLRLDFGAGQEKINYYLKIAEAF